MLYHCTSCGDEKNMSPGKWGQDCFSCGSTETLAAVDIEIDGKLYSLPKIKEHIESRMTQTEFAKRCGYATNSQTSRQLRGLRKPKEKTIAGIVDVVDLDSGDFDAGGGAPSAPSTRATKVEVKDDSFPYREATKTQQLTVAGAKEGSVEATFGFRRLKLWQRAFLCFTDHGHDAKDSLGAAYWLAHGWKLSDEGQLFAENLFHRVFGFMPAEPQDLVEHDDHTHPAEAVAEIILDGGFHVFGFGETGEGKSFGLERQARRISPVKGPDGRGKIAVVSVHEAMSTEHIVASGAARASENGATETFTQKRVVVLSAEEGFPLVMDEPTVARPGILMVLQRLLENGSYYMPETGLWIVAAPTWRLILTDNTNGMGRDSRYNTRKPLDEAFKDRFLFLKWGEMPEEQKEAILSDDATEYRRQLDDGDFLAHATPEVHESLDGLDDTERSKDPKPVQGLEGFI